MSHMPRIITPIRSRPVLIKAPVTPVTIPRQIIVRDNESDSTPLVPGGSKAKLKFGIDSILGKDSVEPKRASVEDGLGEPDLFIYRSSIGILKMCCLHVKETHIRVIFIRKWFARK